MGANESRPDANGTAKKSSRSGSKKIPKSELEKIVKYLEDREAAITRRIDQLESNGGAGWAHEYGQFTKYNNQPATNSLKTENLTKNRYRNIVAYDHSRVKIQPNKFTHNSDYINGNHVDIPGQYKYIATQGPVPDSFCGFWQMVWENDCPVIAMVTNEVEGGKLKCHRYWPDDDEEQADYGLIRVIPGPQKAKTFYIQRRFMLQHIETKEEREVVHLLYTAWPDHGVPNSYDEMLNFRKAVNKHMKPGDTLCIHCSAGVGRTGTYIAIDWLIQAIEDGKTTVDPFDAVMQMRRSRNYLVQTVVQYQFVFGAIREAIQKRLHKARRALKETKQGLTDADKNMEELERLEEELAQAQEDFAGFAGIEDEVEKELKRELEGGKKEEVVVHARHDEQQDDKTLAARVTRERRIESLMTSVSSDKWRETVGDLEKQGYRTQAAPISERLAQLAENASEDAWKQRYDAAISNWGEQQESGGEEYDVGKELNPVENRIESLRQQAMAWESRSPEERRQAQDDILNRISSFQDRFKSLLEHAETSDERWRERGDGLRGQAVVERKQDTESRMGGIRDRLSKLKQQQDTWKTRGDGFRGVVARQPAESANVSRTKSGAANADKAAEDEAPTPQPDAAKEETKPTAQDKEADRTPVNARPAANDDDDDEPEPQIKFNLKKVEKKRASHPMIAAASSTPNDIKRKLSQTNLKK